MTRQVEEVHRASRRGRAVPPRHGSGPQSPSTRPPSPASRCHLLPTLAREGSRRSAPFCPCPSLPALPSQPEPTSPGRREGPPRALPGLDPLSPAPSEWEQPGCPLPTHNSTPHASPSPLCVTPTPHTHGTGGSHLPPATHSHTPPLTSHPFSRGDDAVSVQSRAQGTWGGTGWVQGPEDRDRGTALPTRERKVGRDVHSHEHTL